MTSLEVREYQLGKLGWLYDVEPGVWYSPDGGQDYRAASLAITREFLQAVQDEVWQGILNRAEHLADYSLRWEPFSEQERAKRLFNPRPKHNDDSAQWQNNDDSAQWQNSDNDHNNS